MTVNSDFLTPCDSFNLTAGADQKAIDIARDLAADSKVQILVGSEAILTGYVDEVDLEPERGGTSVRISGRDILGPVVDGHVDPRLQVGKETTIEELVSLVLSQWGLPYGILRQNNSAAALSRGAPRKEWSKSRHKRRDPIKDVKPRSGEGAFGYLSRILQHYGYWLYASAEGDSVVVAGPDYDHEPAFKLVRAGMGKLERAQGGCGNNIIKGSAKTSTTSMPSHVYVRGADSSRGEKAKILVCVTFDKVRRFKPMYIEDQHATDAESAERIARLALAKKACDFFSYNCTVSGFRDSVKGGIYCVDGIAQIYDQACGVRGPMWIKSRTFTQSRSGSFTDLSLIPLGTLLFDLDASEQSELALPYEKALSQMVTKNAPVLSGNFSQNGVDYFIKS